MAIRIRLLNVLPMLLLALGLYPAVASAQQFLIHNYEDNLPSLDVMSVGQDQDGLMWFATRAGMARFDGINWEIVNPTTDKKPQSYRHVKCDSKGTIWSLSIRLPFVISSFDGTEWKTHSQPPTEDWGWDVIDFAVADQPDGTTYIAIVSDKIFSFWNGQQWHQFGHQQKIHGIRALAFLGRKIYLATDDGLLVFDTEKPGLFPVHPAGMEKGPVHALATDHSKTQGLWLVGPDWVGHFSNGNFHKSGTELNLDFSKLENGTSALAGPAGGLFFGGTEGFFHFHPQRGLIRLDRSNGFVSGGITDLLLDREQNVWVASPRGISKLVSMKVESFDSQSGQNFDEVSAIIQLSDGTMVLGHEGELTFWDSHPVTIPVSRDIPGTGRVMDFETGPDGELWIAFDQWGLALFNEDRTWKWFGVDDGLPDYTFALHYDQSGDLWVGGSGGLYRKVGDHFEHMELETPNSNAIPFVRRINESTDGTLLVSTGMLGIFALRDGEIKWWADSPDGLQRSCYQVFDRGNGQYWVATSAGLCRINNGKLELTTAPEPEIDRPIYCILEDDHGCVWFGTDQGVLCWDAGKLTMINNQDGIRGREFNRDALMVADDGRIWMGTDRGLSIYDRRLDQPRLTRPLVSTQSPLVDGLALELDGETALDPSIYEVVFPFRGISFLDENRILFRTWLEGLEPEWQPYQKFPTRRIRYTNLPPGDYRFHVQARNSAGQESDQASSEFFRVSKHFSQTLWFTLLEVFVGLVVAMVILSLFMGRRYQQQLRVEVKQRTEELRVTETVVRSESRRLFSILTSISDGVLALDRDRKVVISNPTVLAILGVRLDEVVGQDLEEILTVDPPLVLDAKPLLSENQGIPVYQFTPRSGDVRYLEISVAPMATDGETPGGWVLAFRDVTERQNREKELIRIQQLESLGVLAGGIAHDFNNLLTIMLGNLSLVENADDFGEEEKSRLGRMKVATLRAQGLAEQLLTFAKGGDPVLQSVDLGVLVEQSTAFALSGSKVSSRLHIPPGLWPVLGDPGQLGQVVNNLVINAMQAMPGGGVMRVDMRNLDRMPGSLDDERCVCMEIMDKGEGIEFENLNRIFNPYFTTKGTGSGLGLTIAHSIVTHHGGMIKAESELGKGTIFRTYLPVAPLASEDVPVSTSREFPMGLRVLILDDEKDVVLLAEQMLRRLGVKCEGVSDGEAAVQTFAAAMGQNKPFSVFIADLTIPGGVGGVEAFKKIRAMDKNVRGIVISGYSNDAVMADFEEYGFAAAVRKPFEQAEFVESLNVALKGFRG